MAVTADGSIFLGFTDDDFVGSLARVSPDGAELEVVIPADGTLLRPQGLWYDAFTDSLLLADVNADTIYEVDPHTYALTVLTTAVPEPSDATRRPGEELTYVTARAEGLVYAVTPDGAATALPGSVPDAHSLVPGQNGELYVMATGIQSLVSVDQEGGGATVLATRFSTAPPVGVCLDVLPNGLFLTDHAGATMHHYDITTGEVEPFFQVEEDVYECGHDAAPDYDGDGWFTMAHAGDDCNDYDADVFPGQGC